MYSGYITTHASNRMTVSNIKTAEAFVGKARRKEGRKPKTWTLMSILCLICSKWTLASVEAPQTVSSINILCDGCWGREALGLDIRLCHVSVFDSVYKKRTLSMRLCS